MIELIAVAVLKFAFCFDFFQTMVARIHVAPPVSSKYLCFVEKRARHSEMKPAREEKAPKKDSITVTDKKKSVLTILVAITLFLLVILAFVQPVGFQDF